MGRPMNQSAVLECHIAEIEASALHALEFPGIPGETQRLLGRIVELAHYTQGVKSGVRSKDGKFNTYLAELCGIENLS